MIDKLIWLVKQPVVRTLLIAWVLFYVICQITSAQYMRNVLALPVIIWMVFSLVAAWSQLRRARKQLVADIKEFSQVSNPDHFDSCRESAMALNYNARTIYLIDGKKRRAISCNDILRWEMFYNDGDMVSGFVVGGSPGSPAGQAVMGAALGGGILFVISRILFKRKDIGHVKFWVNDAEHTIMSVYVSNNKIIEQLQHFSMSNGLKIH